MMNYEERDGLIYEIIETEVSRAEQFVSSAKKIILTSDKNTIKADGIEKVEIMAHLFDWKGFEIKQVIPVTFFLNGETIVKNTNNLGFVSIEFMALTEGIYNFSCAAVGYDWGNISVEVV